MTCIIGLEEDDGVYLAADSSASDGYISFRTDECKVFINSPFIIGYTTSFRYGNLLEHSWTPPHREDAMSDHKYLCTSVVDSIRECLTKGGFAEKDKEVESGGTCLMGYNGRLYMMQNGYSVLRQTPFGAIGCGREVALGAMYVSSEDVEERLVNALHASAEYCVSVSRPFHIKYGGSKLANRGY